MIHAEEVSNFISASTADVPPVIATMVAPAWPRSPLEVNCHGGEQIHRHCGQPFHKLSNCTGR